MIGNMCKLDRDELACGTEFLPARFRVLPELNDGDVFADSDNFICVVTSGAFKTSR